MRTFVIGDIHGTHKALAQCLKRSGFDHARDRLIVLGDVCDGYPDVKQCFDELLKVKNLDLVLGNHDFWAREWATRGIKEDVWLTQGGDNTVVSYGDKGMPPAHVELLQNATLIWNGTTSYLSTAGLILGNLCPNKAWKR